METLYIKTERKKFEILHGKCTNITLVEAKGRMSQGM